MIRLVIVAGLSIALNPLASADALFWNLPGSGSASAAGSWAPAQVPSAADQLLYSVTNTYTVTFNSSVAQSLSQNVGRGTVTLSFTSPHATSNLLVADSANQTATTIVSGQLDVTNLIRLANLSTDVATLTVNSFMTTVDSFSTIVGDDGTGTLNVNFGASFDAGALSVGRNATGIGTVNVDDAPSFPPTAPKLFATSGLIGESGDGELHVFDEGDAAFSADLTIAKNSGSSGVVDVEDGDLTVGGDLRIGNNTDATAAGIGTFTVLDGALVDVNGTTTVGDANGGDGSLILDGTGTFVTGALVYQNVNADLILRHGLLVVDGGAIDPPTPNLVVDSPTGGMPIVELRNGAHVVGSTNPVQIGDGELRVTNATNESLPVGLRIGETAGDIGIVTVDSGCSLSAGTVHVGTAGDGSLLVNGSFTSLAGIALGGGATGFGALDVMGKGALFEATGMSVGGTAGGVGIVTIGDGGAVLLEHPGFLVDATIFPGSVIHLLEDGVLELLGSTTIDVQGQLAMAGGSASANNLEIRGEVSGYGNIDAAVSFEGTGARVVNAGGGTLTLGHDGIGGYNGGGGTLNVGAGTVVIPCIPLTGNVVGLGTVTINGGILQVTNAATGNLSGNGILRGLYRNNGTFANTAGGLHIQGQLTSENQTINGTVLTIDGPTGSAFGGGGGTPAGKLVGRGTITSRVVGAAGSIIQANGALTMGTATPSGVTLHGTLDVGAHTVTLIDSSGVGLGEMTSLNGGTLVQSVNVFPGVGEVLRGVGTIQTNLINGGIVQPGVSSGGGIGTLNVSGTYNQFLGTGPGDLEIEIASLSSIDRLAVTGAASLDGDLIIKPVSGFAAVVGQEFTVLTAASVNGAFDRAIYLGTSCIDAMPIYQANQVRVRFINSTCPGDTNDDGLVNVTDLLAVIAAWGSAGGNGLADVAPACGNGVVNVQDLLAVISGWGACP